MEITPDNKEVDLHLILGNQLFPLSNMRDTVNAKKIFMKEDYELCTYQKHHKHKITLFLSSMRSYKDYLEKHGMVVKTSEIINIHGSKVVLEDDVPEYQKLVVATDTMDSESWRKARIFAWMSSFLYFDKIALRKILKYVNHYLHSHVLDKNIDCPSFVLIYKKIQQYT